MESRGGGVKGIVARGGGFKGWDDPGVVGGIWVIGMEEWIPRVVGVKIV